MLLIMPGSKRSAFPAKLPFSAGTSRTNSLSAWMGSVWGRYPGTAAKASPESTIIPRKSLYLDLIIIMAAEGL